MLDKLSSDLESDDTLSFNDKKTIQKFLDDMDNEYFDYGFGFDKFIREELKQKLEETSASSEDGSSEPKVEEPTDEGMVDNLNPSEDGPLTKHAILIEENKGKGDLTEIGVDEIDTELESSDTATLDDVFYGNSFSDESDTKLFNDKDFFKNIINNIYPRGNLSNNALDSSFYQRPDNDSYVERPDSPFYQRPDHDIHIEGPDSPFYQKPDNKKFVPEEDMDPAIRYVIANFYKTLSNNDSIRL